MTTNILLWCVLVLTSIATTRSAFAAPADFRASSGSGRRLLQVALMHRHGARTGPQITPTGLSWDACVLSDTGAQMAVGLGRFLRRFYAQSQPSDGWGVFCPRDTLPAGPTTGCIGRQYDRSQIVSQSTDFERTIRTGFGVVRGMFSGLPAGGGAADGPEYVVPYLRHLPAAMDMKLGYYYSWPSAVMHEAVLDRYNDAHDPQTLDILNQSALNAIAPALGSVERCRTQQTLCILLAQDVTACDYSNSPAVDATLLTHWPHFRLAQQRSNAYLYLYNANLSSRDPSDSVAPAAQSGGRRFSPAATARRPATAAKNIDRLRNVGGRLPSRAQAAPFRGASVSDSYSLLQDGALWRATGPFGRVAAREICEMFAVRLAPNASGAPLIRHYSAHDVTIYGLLVAVGAIRPDNMYVPAAVPPSSGADAWAANLTALLVPEFASVALLELYSDGNVSLRFARPPQAHGAAFEAYELLSRSVVQFTCTSAAGVQYRAAECPLADLRRFVEALVPWAWPASPDAAASVASSVRGVPSAALAAAAIDTALTVVPPQAGQLYDTYDSYAFCYSLPSDLAAQACERSDTRVPTSAACLAYRAACPAFACAGPRFVLNASSLACVDTQAHGLSDRARLLRGSGARGVAFYVGTVVSALFMGIFLGITIGVARDEARLRRGEQRAGLLPSNVPCGPDAVNETASCESSTERKQPPTPPPQVVAPATTLRAYGSHGRRAADGEATRITPNTSQLRSHPTSPQKGPAVTD